MKQKLGRIAPLLLTVALLSLLAVPFLSISPVQAITKTFGNTSIGGDGEVVSHIIRGSVFTMPEWGNVTSITAALALTPYEQVQDDVYATAAIYKHSDFSLVATSSATCETLYGFEFTWTQMNFASPTLQSSVEYILVVHTSYGVETFYEAILAYDAGTANQGHYQSSSYPTFPNTLGPAHDNNEYSIYATYVVTEEPEPTPTPSPSPMPTIPPASPPFGRIPWVIAPLLFIIITIGGFGIIAYLFTSIRKLSDGVKVCMYILITVLAMILGWFVASALWGL